MKTSKYNIETERLFYFVLRGKKTEQKRIILSKCLLICALKWRNLSKKDFGKPLQPTTMAVLLRMLFSVFSHKGIRFKHLKHFNGDGEYHAVLRKQWEETMKQDPTYATGVGTSTFDYEADRKIRDAYKGGKWDPFSTSDGNSAYDHRKQYLVFVLGRYWLLRGRKELSSLKWSQIKFCEVHENGKLVKYIEIVQTFDKGNPLKLSNTTPRNLQDCAPRIYPNPKDPLCPYKFLTFYRSLCTPTQERVFCAKASIAQMKEYRANNLPYLYNEKKPVGENNIDGNTKDFAKEMGFDNWQRCTNHGNRKLGITTIVTNADAGIAPLMLQVTRHKRIQTSMAYQKENPQMQKTYNKAVVGKHVNSPPESPDNHKMPRHDQKMNANSPPNDDDKPKMVLVPSKPMDSKTAVPPLLDNVSVTTAQSSQHLLQQPGHSDTMLPLVTPNTLEPGHTIVTQHHLNNIQRNIFLPPNNEFPNIYRHDYYKPDQLRALQHSTSETKSKIEECLKLKDEENKELKDKIRALEDKLVQAKEKYEDNLAEYKEKYEEARHDLREARQQAKFADMHFATISNKNSCIIL